MEDIYGHAQYIYHVTKTILQGNLTHELPCTPLITRSSVILSASTTLSALSRTISEIHRRSQNRGLGYPEGNVNYVDTSQKFSLRSGRCSYSILREHKGKKEASTTVDFRGAVGSKGNYLPPSLRSSHARLRHRVRMGRHSRPISDTSTSDILCCSFRQHVPAPSCKSLRPRPTLKSAPTGSALHETGRQHDAPP